SSSAPSPWRCRWCWGCVGSQRCPGCRSTWVKSAPVCASASPRPTRDWPMSAELCSEEEVARLVHAFYARVRQDAALGPIFDAKVDDWDQHLAKLVDFWSSILRRTG